MPHFEAGLKVFTKRLDKRTLAAFEREQAALRGIPSILPTELVTHTDGNHALRTEVCPRSLATLVEERGPLPPADVVVLGRTLALALAAAHRAGVVHGGVTPHNVLFRASGEPVLADCGVTLRHAFPCDPLHAIEFQPPETVRSGTLDEHTDLYGLGALLHYAITGHSPHPGRLGERPAERVLRVLSDPVPELDRPDVPPPLATALTHLLAVDPGGFTAAEAAEVLTPPAVDEFDDFTSAPPPVGRTPVYVSTSETSPRRSRLPLLVGAAALVLVAAFAVVVVNRPPEPRSLPAPSSTAAPTSAATPVTLDLADPVDRGEQVELKWTSQATLDFGVAIAEEGQPPRFEMANRAQSTTITVDPIRKYCFQIHASDGAKVYKSVPKAVRGATCKS